METVVSIGLTRVRALGNLDSSRRGKSQARSGQMFLPNRFIFSNSLQTWGIPKGEKAKRLHESHSGGQDQRTRRGTVEKIGTEYRGDNEGDHRGGTGGCRSVDCAQRDARDGGSFAQGAEIARRGARRSWRR